MNAEGRGGAALADPPTSTGGTVAEARNNADASNRRGVRKSRRDTPGIRDRQALHNTRRGIDSPGDNSITRSRSRMGATKKNSTTVESETDEEEDNESYHGSPNRSRTEDDVEDEKDDVMLVEDDTQDHVQSGVDPTTQLTKEEAAEVKRIVLESNEMITDILGEKACPVLEKVKKDGGRGREVTTRVRYLKRMVDAQKRLIDLAKDLKNLRDEGVAAKLSKSREAEERKAREELRNMSTVNLSATITDAVRMVDKINEKAGSLKGEHQSMLKKAAARITAAATIWSGRYVDQGTGQRDEEDLREKITEQEREILSLHEDKARHRREMDEMRGS